MSLLVKGIRKLSQLDVDVDKDWGNHLIRNIGAAVNANDALRRIQAILQAVMTTTGDIIYRGPSEASRLAPSYGVGYNFLHGKKVGDTDFPEWLDIQDIVAYLTGSPNKMAAPPTLVGGGGFTAEKTLTIPDPPSIGVSQLVVFDQRYESGDDGDFSIGGLLWEAQTFIVNVAHSIEIIEIKCRRVLSPGDITIGIRDTDGLGLPTGPDLTSITFDGNALGTTAAWVTRYVTGYSLSAATKYALVIRAPSGDAANYLVWRKDGTVPTYAGGARCFSIDGGGSWSEDVNTDFMFREGEIK